jgi:NAD(P)H-hydrate epimerase
MAREVLTVAEVREYDRRAVESLGIPGAVLMENAGRAAAEECLAELAARGTDTAGRAAILVGPGKNGGDGYVIARHLANAGMGVELYSSATRDSLRGDAALFRRVIDRLGLPTREVVTAHQLARERGRWASAVVLVDALLGTGFEGELRPQLAALLEAANAASGPLKLAVDLPSGLDADTGRAAAHAFRADLTVTFVAVKPGLLVGAGPALAGRVAVRGIGAPRDLLERELG